MKKIYLILCFLVGLLSLSSCENSENISYVDSNGETQTLKVTATDDQEVVEKVVDYAIDANYDELSNFKFNVAANVNATFNKQLSSAFNGEIMDDFNGSLKLDLNAVKTDGLDASLDFDMSLGESNKMRLNADCIYNGSLTDIKDESYLYVKGLYYEKSNSVEETETIKNAYKLMPIINNILPSDTTVPTSPKDLIDLKEIIENSNTKFIISSVKNGVIYLDATISIKELLSSLKSVGEIQELINLLGSSDIKVTFSYGLEAKTGIFKSFSFSYVDTALINDLISNSFNMINIKVLEKFELNFKISLETNNAKIKKLSDEEKAKYSISDDILM